MADVRFDSFFTRLMKYEGGYVNDPDDPGGETKYGICKRSYPDINIKTLTIERAKAIYFTDYYIPMNIATIVEDELAWQVFDFGVNAGIGRAVKMLQIMVEAFPDGKLGNKTLQKITDYSSYYPLWVDYVGERIKYYKQLTLKKPKNKKFLKGWALRTLEL